MYFPAQDVPKLPGMAQSSFLTSAHVPTFVSAPHNSTEAAATSVKITVDNGGAVTVLSPKLFAC